MNDFDGYVLAGGASRRMGRAKANLRLGGKTFVERAANALSAISPKRLLVVGNLLEMPPGLSALPDKFNTENAGQTRGSIIGLHAALSDARNDWAAALACDLPFVCGELFRKLASSSRKDFDAVVPLQNDDRPQPLCALYRAGTCLPVIEKMLGEENWKLRNLLQSVKTRFVSFDEISDLPHAEHFFFNVNTPEDFREAQMIENSLGS
ncbi:MAG TPA: molybdenum cofactor guanylyltransferase [Pyrinomonadaceae bacterium]|jgi:molybdopterin-guanine dinucleotide biosynthesis protein A